jgi:glycosyltransferase involved in cell wall biosynthesis
MSRKKVASIVLNNFMNDSRVLKESISLSENGYDVTVVALRPADEPARETIGKVKVRRLKLYSWALPEGKFFGALKHFETFLAIFLRYRSYDIWHCNDFMPLFFAWLSKPFRLRKKVVYDSHEYQSERLGIEGANKWFVEKFEARAIKIADAVITVSDGIVRDYKRLFNLDIVHLILNAPAFRNPESSATGLREELGVRPDQRIFLYSGGFAKGRGIEVLLEAFSKRTGDDAVMLFLGGGKLERMVKDYSIRFKNIFYHPSVPYEQVVKTASQADYGMLSTENLCLNNFFCMPNKLFEYIQAGLPVLTADLKDCRELVEREGIGLTSDNATITGWNELIDRALEIDIATFDKAMKRASEKFNWENEEKKLIKIYQNLE